MPSICAFSHWHDNEWVQMEHLSDARASPGWFICSLPWWQGRAEYAWKCATLSTSQSEGLTRSRSDGSSYLPTSSSVLFFPCFSVSFRGKEERFLKEWDDLVWEMRRSHKLNRIFHLVDFAFFDGVWGVVLLKGNEPQLNIVMSTHTTTNTSPGDNMQVMVRRAEVTEWACCEQLWSVLFVDSCKSIGHELNTHLALLACRYSMKHGQSRYMHWKLNSWLV